MTPTTASHGQIDDGQMMVRMSSAGDAQLHRPRQTTVAVPVVELVGAAAAVGGRQIWSHVNLTVQPGEFVAVLGPNGVGKSTLLKLILGLVPVTEGQASVLGARPGQHNKRIGYLPQRRAFDPATRVRGIDIVRLGLDGDRWGLPLPSWVPGSHGRAAQARVEEVIELVGATSYARRPIGQCSGGEQQRLLIAQTLVRRPDLLILDEPLDSLDVTNQASVSALIRDVSHSQRVAVMLVAHDVNPILSYLDQVIYLSHGGAVMGRPAEVITADTLTLLYGTPIDVLTDRAGRLVIVGQPDTHTHHHNPA
jgi:zinc/manganese transport system ATP-binding protein